MKVYNYHPHLKYFLSVCEADESPLEPGEFLLPAHSTTIAPPECEEGEIPVWRDGWIIGHDIHGVIVTDNQSLEVARRNIINGIEAFVSNFWENHLITYKGHKHSCTKEDLQDLFLYLQLLERKQLRTNNIKLSKECVFEDGSVMFLSVDQYEELIDLIEVAITNIDSEAKRLIHYVKTAEVKELVTFNVKNDWCI